MSAPRRPSRKARGAKRVPDRMSRRVLRIRRSGADRRAAARRMAGPRHGLRRAGLPRAVAVADRCRRSSPIARCSPTRSSSRSGSRSPRSRSRRVAGTLVALLFVQSRWIEMSLFPYAVLLQVTPIVAIAPLIIIWVKDTRIALVLCAVVVAIFPIIANTTLGLRSVDHGLLNLFRMCRANRWQVLLRLRIPGALPYFFGGLRIASGLALIGAVVAEFVAGTGGQGAGLAYQILLAGMQLNIPAAVRGAVPDRARRHRPLRRDRMAVARRALALARERDRGAGLTRHGRRRPWNISTRSSSAAGSSAPRSPVTSRASARDGVLLLERGTLGSGTSAQSSCIVRTHYSVPANVALARGRARDLSEVSGVPRRSRGRLRAQRLRPDAAGTRRRARGGVARDARRPARRRARRAGDRAGRSAPHSPAPRLWR